MNKTEREVLKEILNKKDNKTLTTLNLSNKWIDDESALIIAEFLENNATLTTLNLSINQIGAKGANAIAEALKTNATLTTLNLSNNQIGVEGANAIAESLKDNKTLKIDLTLNHILTSEDEYLKGKKYLSIYGNDSSDEEDEVESYDIVKQIRKYKEDNKEEAVFLPFVVHAVAIKFLYSKQIQQKYYVIKKAQCKDSFEVPEKNIINRAISNSVNQEFKWGLKENQGDQQKLSQFVFDLINDNIVSFYKTGFVRNDLIHFFRSSDKEWDFNALTFLAPRASHHSFKVIDMEKLELCDLRRVLKLEKKLIIEYKKALEVDVSQFDSVAFFAQLRWHNRIDKRLEKDISNIWCNEQKKHTCAKTDTLKYSDNVSVLVSHGVSKQSKIYRSETIDFESDKNSIASYPTIYSNVKITLSDYDQLTKPFYKIEIDKLSQDASSLHYLLYGTEVVRNPSALIHNMMAMELISNGKMTWKEALHNREIPMCIEGALQDSRSLNKEYNRYMPHKYKYENGTDRDKTTLITKEKNLVIKWLKLKFGENYLKACFNKDGKDLKITHAVSMFDILETACNNWYIGENEVKKDVSGGTSSDDNVD
jgi:hypothetical protein